MITQCLSVWTGKIISRFCMRSSIFGVNQVNLDVWKRERFHTLFVNFAVSLYCPISIPMFLPFTMDVYMKESRMQISDNEFSATITPYASMIVLEIHWLGASNFMSSAQREYFACMMRNLGSWRIWLTSSARLSGKASRIRGKGCEIASFTQVQTNFYPT